MKNNAVITFILALVLSPQIVLAQTAADQGRANLESMRSFIGTNAATYVGKYNLHLVMDCSVSEVADPDAPAHGMATAPRLQAYREVYEHNGRTTDRTSNHGIKSYMADSIASESSFFQAAFAFYSWLKKRDQEWRTLNENKLNDAMTVGPSPINVLPSNQNIYEQALSFAGGNAYMAMKILALYGHDNMVNSLQDETNDCRARILDSVRPSSSSQLYHSGAIHALPYSTAQIEQSTGVATACASANTALQASDRTLARELSFLCNDGYSIYQADYYHVLASAFITCRGEIAHNLRPSLPATMGGPASALLDDSASAARILAIRSYKIARFQEEIARAQISTSMRSYLRYALAKIAAGMEPMDTAWVLFSATLSINQANMLKAIVKRYQHEIQFRSYQNRIGAQFAVTNCRSLNQYGVGAAETNPDSGARKAQEQGTSPAKSSGSTGSEL